MTMTAREAAFKALTVYKKTGSWTDAVLNNVLTREKLDERESALASRLFYGVVQNMALCDYYIAHFSSVKLFKMQPQVLGILRLSVYQLVFMSKIPVNAAVSEGVELAKKFSNPRAASFVNAVLRKLSANMDRLPAVKAETAAERLSILYSHPEWLVRAFISRLGEEEAEALLKINNEPAIMTAMVNTLKADVQTVLTSLDKAGAGARAHPWLPDCLELKSAHRLDRLEAFKDGWFYIQDPAAALSVRAAEPKPELSVIDGCAAPGGKSFAAAVLMEDQGSVLSCDIRENKLLRVKDGAQRLGLKCVEPRLLDARELNEKLVGKADLVIADVPCSGLGVIRKKPEIRYKNPAEFEKLPEYQLQILKNLSQYVKPGGVLMYSTCTLLEQENETVVAEFLKSNTDYMVEPFTLPEPLGKIEAGMLTLWPQINGTDGFFISKIRRKS